jgi:hypothetical protein
MKRASRCIGTKGDASMCKFHVYILIFKRLTMMIAKKTLYKWSDKYNGYFGEVLSVNDTGWPG